MVNRCELCGQFKGKDHVCTESWNKGIKTGRIPKTAFKKGQVPWNKDREIPEQELIELRKKGFGFKKGHCHTEKIKEKISEGHKGKPSGMLGKKMSKRSNMLRKKAMKKIIKEDPTWIKKCLKRNLKSNLEIKFEQIINKLNLPYKFVGNGEFIIGRKCPDFINCNGQKIAVEVFCRKHKEKFRGGLTKWMEEREKIFNLYNWKIEFFNETQINLKEINRRIG